MEYFENPLMPGKPMFRCDRLAATLKVESCAAMWREANASQHGAQKNFKCMQCRVGAEHAGEVDASQSWLRSIPACSRCHRADLRLVGGNICIGCYNRQREWVVGRNGKGKFPVRCAPLEPRAVVYVVQGRVERLSRPLTTGTLELVVEVLRDSQKRAVFGWGVGKPWGRNAAG